MGFSLVAVGDVTKVSEQVRIDGRLDEPSWEKAQWEGGFRRIGSGKGANGLRKPSVRTEFAILADDESVYVGVRACHERVDELKRMPRTSIWGAESVEIFLAPDGGDFEYYQFVVTYQGDVHQLFCSERGHTRPDPYGPVWEHRTSATDYGWSAEVRIPFSAFYMTRGKAWSGTWRVNVARNYRRQEKADMENSCWTDAGMFYSENLRPIGGFPSRRAEDDVFMKSAVATADTIKLSAFVAKGGDFLVSSAYSDPLKVSLRPGDNEIRLPSRLPPNGRHLTRFTMKRADDGTVCERDYPVMVDVRPVRLKLTKPQYRSNFYPGQDASRVEGSVEALADCPIELAIEGPGFGRRELKLEKGGRFSFDTSGFADGDATLTAACGTNTLTRRIRKLPPLPAGRHMSWVENGNLVVDGKPVFRRNMYAEGWMGGEAFARKYATDDQHQTPAVGCLGDFDPTWFDKSIKNGEALQDRRPSQRMLDHIDDVIEKGKSREGCYYYICDEPECFNLSAVWLRHVYEYAAERDPYHAILSCCRSGEAWIDIADWFEVHPYINAHFDANGNRAYTRQFNELGDFVDMFRPWAHPDKVIGGVPTAFAYGQSDYPTFDEYVLNFWCELMRGAKTMYPYVYHDFGDRAALYLGTRYMFESLEKLEDILLTGRRETLAKTREYEVAVWTMPDGERLLAAVNFTQKPLKAAFKGVEGRFREFRGTRTFDLRSSSSKLQAPGFNLQPLESLVCCDRDRDAGLRPLADVRAEVDRIEHARTHRDNQLFERHSEMGIVTSTGRRGAWRDDPIKMFDGTRGVSAWCQEYGKEKFYEMSFSKFVPVFDALTLYGRNIEGFRVKIRQNGEWATLEPSKTEKSEYRITYRYGRKLSTVKLRLEFPLDHVEVYELELPGKARELGKGAWKPTYGGEIRRFDVPAGASTNLSWTVAAVPKPAFLCFRIDEAGESRDSAYTEWNLELGPRLGLLAKAVGPATPGLYTLRLPSRAAGLPNLTLLLRNYNLVFGKADLVLADQPSDSAEFVEEEDGGCRVRVRLSAPCEDLVCAVFAERGRGPVPVAVNGSKNAVDLKPVDASRRVWEGRVASVPRPEGAKIFYPYVRVDVLGGVVREPIFSWLSK